MEIKTIEEFEGHCEKHGPYIGKRRFFFGKEVTTLCPQCTQENIQEQKRAREQAQRMELRGYCIDQSNIPPRFREKTLEQFIATTQDQKKAFDTVADYLASWEAHRKSGDGLVFLGQPGTGKTHLAAAIGIELCNRGQSVLYQKTADIMRRIKETYGRDAKETENGVYKELLSYDLLIIDEIGRQAGTEAEKLMLFEIINGRYEYCKPLILISNGTFEDLKQYITEAGFDRLKEIGKSVIFTSESMRGRI